MRVFVHLAHGAGGAAWKARWEKTLGINHDNLYGYQLAAAMGCSVEQSEDRPEGKAMRLFRLGLRRMVGFDLLHTWHNRKGILSAEVVWTHTEMESMAVLLLFRLSRSSTPKLIAQNIWVFDEWDYLSAPRKWVYHGLLSRADVLTVHSPLNLERARMIFPGRPVECVRFGIRNDLDLHQPGREMHTPVRILTVGNDRHRDWPTFVAAFRDNAAYQAKMVVSRNAPDLAGITNIERVKPTHNDDLFALLRWADFMVVPLKANLHASGITAVQEAVLFGLPVVVADTGGLRFYFSDDEVTYVPSGDPSALQAVVDTLRASPELREAKATRALTRMKQGQVNSEAFVREHVVLSRQLLGLPAADEVLHSSPKAQA